MKKIVKLTETDLTRLVKRTINEMDDMDETMSLENIYDEYLYTKKEFERDFRDFATDYLERLEFLLEKIDELDDEEYKEGRELEADINDFYHKLGDLYYLD